MTAAIENIKALIVKSDEHDQTLMINQPAVGDVGGIDVSISDPDAGFMVFHVEEDDMRDVAAYFADVFKLEASSPKPSDHSRGSMIARACKRRYEDNPRPVAINSTPQQFGRTLFCTNTGVVLTGDSSASVALSPGQIVELMAFFEKLITEGRNADG